MLRSQLLLEDAYQRRSLGLKLHLEKLIREDLPALHPESPLKIQSDMRSARSILWLCSPNTHEIASTTFDLPHPLGPTMHVMPVPLNVIGVFSQNDLKPNSSTLRSFSTLTLAQIAPLVSTSEGTSS